MLGEGWDTERKLRELNERDSLNRAAVNCALANHILKLRAEVVIEQKTTIKFLRVWTHQAHAPTKTATKSFRDNRGLSQLGFIGEHDIAWLRRHAARPLCEVFFGNMVTGRKVNTPFVQACNTQKDGAGIQSCGCGMWPIEDLANCANSGLA